MEPLAYETVTDNRALLDDLLRRDAIQMVRGTIFDRAPAPLPARFRFDRVEGMMLGLAIGDALGGPSEGRLTGRRAAMFGEIRDYVVGRRAKEPLGYPSDDTQMAFWTLEQMNVDRAFRPERVAARFCRGQLFGIGQTVARFRRNMKSGLPFTECGPASAGNGALMRIAPMVIPHLRTASAHLWSDTALSAMLTHNDSGSIAACVAFVRMLWQSLIRERAPEPRWWLDRYVEVARELETGTTYRPRGGSYQGYEGPMWRFVEERVSHALDAELPIADACNAWYSGAYLLETIPSALLILARHGHDPEEAIVRAVNDTKDNDTIAAIVGAAAGALHGRAGLPTRWIDKLTGRTGKDDDGRVFELLAEARSLWWTDEPPQAR